MADGEGGSGRPFRMPHTLVLPSGEEHPPLLAGHMVIAAGFVAALAVAVWGIATRGWYLTELGPAFLVVGVGAAAARRFVSGAADLTETAPGPGKRS